jgi:hypothetical protein
MKMGVKYLGIMFALVALVGCGGSANPTISIDKAKAEADTMSLSQLENKAKTYLTAIDEQKDQIAKLQASIKAIPLNEVAGAEAKALKIDVADVQTMVSNLTKRYKVYLDKFKAEGGDVSKIQV